MREGTAHLTASTSCESDKRGRDGVAWWGVVRLVGGCGVVPARCVTAAATGGSTVHKERLAGSLRERPDISRSCGNGGKRA